MRDYSKVKYIVPELLNFLRANKDIDGEGLMYFSERYPFNFDDFYGNFLFLNSLDKFHDVDKGQFENEEKGYFIVDDLKFIISTLCGQGCISSIHLPNPRNKYWKFKREYANVLQLEGLEKEFKKWKKEEIRSQKNLQKAFQSPKMKKIFKDLAIYLRGKKK